MASNLRFDDQVVVVTGSGRGLGRAYALLFAQFGAHVVVHDAGVGTDGSGSDPLVAEGVAEEIVLAGGKVTPVTSNLLEPGACRSLIDDTVSELGRIDVLVHNAGVVLWESTDWPEDEIWDQTMGVNATAGFRLVRAALPHMVKQDYGRIVLTTSGRATTIASAAPGLVAYSAAKMAMIGIMNGFKANVLDEDIHLNAISPVADTRVLVRDAPELTGESVAPGVAYLASPQMTESGQVLAAMGGRFAREGWREGDLIDLGPEPIVEDVARVWPDLGPGVSNNTA